MKFVTSFGFRVGLIVVSHLLAALLFTVQGEWNALIWVGIASLWAIVSFRFERQVYVWESIANRWRDLYEKRAGSVS